LLALARLLASGSRVRWALEPFEAGGRRYPPGTLLVPSTDRSLLEPLAHDLGFSASAVSVDPHALQLRPPRVGLYRSWVPAMDEGWTRYVFEKETGVAYRSLHDSDLRRGGLRESYDAIVLPDQPPAAIGSGHPAGSLPAEYTGGVGAPGAAALRAFVEAGGTLVALNAAARYAIAALVLPVRDALAGADPATFYCPGSILEVTVDEKAPLGHGLPSPLPVWFEGSPAFEVERGTVALRYGDEDPLLSGWLLGGDRLKGRAALASVPLGKGRVVLFGFRPQYRAQSRVTYAALLNALYLSAAEP
jgi:hypothetical protein